MAGGALQENQEGLKNVMWFMVIMAIVVLFFNTYFYCYAFYAPLIGNMALDSVVDALNEKVGAFKSPWITIVLAYLLLFVYSYFSGANLSADGKMKVFGKEIAITKRRGVRLLLTGSVVFLLSPLWLYVRVESPALRFTVYIILLLSSILTLMLGAKMIHRVMDSEGDDEDFFNEIQRSAFPQCETLLENRYSVNIPMIYRYGKAFRKGWINIINPFRATSVMGTPGSGKSFAFINEFIRQHLRKGFSMYVYDYKFPTLTRLVYNNYLKNRKNRDIYPVMPVFRMINFDDPRLSHRINPIKASSLTDMLDAYESAYTIMVSLNRTWADKQGDFFVESPINFLAAVIWYLKIADGGRYCSMPHAIEWCGRNTTDIIAIMATHSEIASYMRPFYEALERGVYEQLEGQVSSVQIPLARLKSDDMYWVLSGDDFENGLNINDPDNPVVMCVGNNPDRQTVYSSSLSLINGRLIKNVNKPGRLPLSLIIDELPTIFFKGLDTLISTARSNKVSTCIGYQDNTQLVANYGENEAKKIIRTVGNTISGQVNRDAAQELQEMFGRNKQHKRNISTSSEGSVSVSVDEQQDYMIPASVIAQLSQGVFVGLTADEVRQKNEYPVFYAKTDLDIKAIDEEEKSFAEIPQVYIFNDERQFERIIKVLESERISKLYSEGVVDKARSHLRSLKGFDFKGGCDLPGAERIVKDLKKDLQSLGKEGAKLASDIDRIQRMTINERMKANTERIDRELDELIEREINKINTDPRYENIKRMRNRILQIEEEEE